MEIAKREVGREFQKEKAEYSGDRLRMFLWARGRRSVFLPAKQVRPLGSRLGEPVRKTFDDVRWKIRVYEAIGK